MEYLLMIIKHQNITTIVCHSSYLISKYELHHTYTEGSEVEGGDR